MPQINMTAGSSEYNNKFSLCLEGRVPSFQWKRSALLLVALLSSAALAQNTAPITSEPVYPDSAEGLQAQFAAMVLVARSHNEAQFRTALDGLKIHNADKWFADRFDPHFLPQLSREYAMALTRYQEHLSWVMANFAKFDDFAVKVEPSETPAPMDVTGGKFVAPLTPVKVENFRMTSAASDPGHGPPSWVRSFVYIDGKFRYVGGTYTFWEEGLDGARGPASLPSMVLHDRNVSGILGWVDTSRMGPGIDGVVQFTVKMEPDNKIHTTVEEGEAPFITDAEKYLQAQNYGRSADSIIPKTSHIYRSWRAGDTGVTTTWSVEVVFWTTKH